MTLIITELSAYGIVMVADSAVTKEFKLPSRPYTYQSVLTGVKKLQYIKHLKAGISVWGLGEIEVNKMLIPTEIWLEDFILRHQNITSLDKFASTLAEELQKVVGDTKRGLGFHLAGYVKQSGHKLPTFYHIRNGDGPYNNYQFHDFVPGHDYPPKQISPGEDPRTTRNGDYGVYALLSSAIAPMLPYIEKAIGPTIPHTSLEGRLEYNAAWVRFISDLYASSKLSRTIGGSVSGIGLSPDDEPIIKTFG